MALMVFGWALGDLFVDVPLDMAKWWNSGLKMMAHSCTLFALTILNTVWFPISRKMVRIDTKSKYNH